MPRPRKELQHYPAAEIDYKCQQVLERMKKLHLEALSYDLSINRGRTIMCLLTEVQTKLELQLTWWTNEPRVKIDTPKRRRKRTNWYRKGSTVHSKLGKHLGICWLYIPPIKSLIPLTKGCH